jgi:hypothetical protein
MVLLMRLARDRPFSLVSDANPFHANALLAIHEIASAVRLCAIASTGSAFSRNDPFD